MTDRTMLAKLGFQDKDRKSPEHQAASLLLISEPDRIVAKLRPDSASLECIKCQPEFPISKGSGQYATTIGFLDAVVFFDVPDFKTRSEADFSCNKCGQREVREGWTTAEVTRRYFDNEYSYSRHDDCTTGKYCYERMSMVGSERPVKRLNTNHIVVEIKSTIDDLGELLRQCNLYRSYLPLMGLNQEPFVVWSLRGDDAKFEKALANSNYKLITGPL